MRIQNPELSDEIYGYVADGYLNTTEIIKYPYHE